MYGANQGARDANDEMDRSRFSRKLDQIIELLEKIAKLLEKKQVK